MLAAIRVAKKIIKPILFIIGIALIIAFAVAWIAAIISLFFGQPFVHAIFPDQVAIANLGVFSLFLMVGLPLLSIIFFISRLLFDTKVSPFLKRSTTILAILAWIGFFAASSYLSANFVTGKNVEILNSTIEDDILEITTQETFENGSSSGIRIDDGNFELFMDNGQLVTQNVQLIFSESEDENINISQKVYTRGNGTQEVEQLAQELDYKLGLVGNQLTIPKRFVIPEGTKYRGQKVIIDVHVPKGKSIRLGKNVSDLDYWFKTIIQKSSTGECPTLTMTEKGFVCPDNVQPPTRNKTETI